MQINTQTRSFTPSYNRNPTSHSSSLNHKLISLKRLHVISRHLETEATSAQDDHSKVKRDVDDLHLATLMVQALGYDEQLHELYQHYQSMNKNEKEHFFSVLANDPTHLLPYGSDSDINTLIDKFQLINAKTNSGMDVNAAAQRYMHQHQVTLRNKLTPLHLKLFQRFQAVLPNGLQFLVKLRRDLLEVVESQRKSQDPKLIALNDDLRELLTSSFPIGSLKMDRVTWNSPASLLEKIKVNEQVHVVSKIEDLKIRLRSNRRIYQLNHPSVLLEDEKENRTDILDPLVFVNIALMTELPNNLEEVYDTVPITKERNPSHCIFYSIVSTEKGLSGIELGHYLIKKAVKELQGEFPSLSHFATFSPIVKFRSWLDSKLMLMTSSKFAEEQLLLPEELSKFKSLVANSTNGYEAFKELLNSDWYSDPVKVEALKLPLLRLCARYLYNEKKRKMALDPVCNFHLKNGARIERLNWMADSTPLRLSQSFGIMVNYEYHLPTKDENSSLYARNGKIAVSESFKRWIRETTG